MERIPILYFSDVLCGWASFAELRLAAVQRTFGERVGFDFRFCSVFDDTQRKIVTAWSAKGRYDGVRRSYATCGAGISEILLHPNLSRNVRHASSLSPHLYLKAVQQREMDEGAPGIFERALRKMREAFFLEGLDIARQDIQREVGRRSNADNDLVLRLVVDGRAHASLDTDYKEAERMGVRGNPREARGTPARPISLSSRRVPI